MNEKTAINPLYPNLGALRASLL